MDHRMSKSPLVRIRPDQLHVIKKTKSLREQAIYIRGRVAGGNYDDSDLQRFYSIATSAADILNISNPELADRAGLGHSFFLTLVRDRRRPKLQNFLRALLAIIEFADERLFDVDNAPKPPQRTDIKGRISEDYEELFLLASSLAQIARAEIAKLEEERPNALDAIAINIKQRELLELFATGFDRIALALANISRSSKNEIIVRKANAVVEGVGNELNAWWNKNKVEAVDWSVRIPVLAGGIALLGLAGAPMTLATTIVATMVGGQKVVEAVKRSRKK